MTGGRMTGMSRPSRRKPIEPDLCSTRTSFSQEVTCAAGRYGDFGYALDGDWLTRDGRVIPGFAVFDQGVLLPGEDRWIYRDPFEPLQDQKQAVGFSDLAIVLNANGKQLRFPRKAYPLRFHPRRPLPPGVRAVDLDFA